MKIACIYKITNKITLEFYIGSTNNFYRRKIQHFSDLKNNKHRNQYLQNVYNKYGFDNLEMQILKPCLLEKLIELEQYYMNKLNPKYNISKIAGKNILSKESLERASKFKYKPILQYDLNGNFIKEFDSIINCSKELNFKYFNIVASLKKMRVVGNSVFIYKTKNIKNKIDISTIQTKIKMRYIKYDEYNNVVSIYTGLNEVFKVEKNIHFLSYAIKTNQKVNGYFWKKEKILKN